MCGFDGGVGRAGARRSAEGSGWAREVDCFWWRVPVRGAEKNKRGERSKSAMVGDLLGVSGASVSSWKSWSETGIGGRN